jgi:hypothetical protein
VGCANFSEAYLVYLALKTLTHNYNNRIGSAGENITDDIAVKELGLKDIGFVRAGKHGFDHIYLDDKTGEIVIIDTKTTPNLPFSQLDETKGRGIQLSEQYIRQTCALMKNKGSALYKASPGGNPKVANQVLKAVDEGRVKIILSQVDLSSSKVTWHNLQDLKDTNSIRSKKGWGVTQTWNKKQLDKKGYLDREVPNE